MQESLDAKTAVILEDQGTLGGAELLTSTAPKQVLRMWYLLYLESSYVACMTGCQIHKVQAFASCIS